MKFLEQFKAARRSSVPLLAIKTADPAATVAQLRKEINGHPLLTWDTMLGYVPLNEAGTDSLAHAMGSGDGMATNGIIDNALAVAMNLQKDTVVFFFNAHLFLNSAGAIQGFWNLRDKFKEDRRTAVLVCPSISLPPEINQDVIVLDDPLPTLEELEKIVLQAYENMRQSGHALKNPAFELLSKMVDALAGLAAFPAEQACAMSMTKAGIDLKELWERKRAEISNAPGLSVYSGPEKFADIGGCSNVKGFITRYLNGKKKPRVIVFLDEVEKTVAGAGGQSGGDSSGTSQGMLGTLLTFMQDHNVKGILEIGVMGAAKSAIAKATGNEANIPTIIFDLNGMKNALIGSSEANMRQALKVVEAVSQGQALFIGTCNRLSAIPPELRRRFNLATFFFDLPDSKERDAIWKIYLKKNELSATLQRPDDTGWTGAEIEQCCFMASNLGYSLIEAGAFIVPVSKSASDDIKNLRTQASGRFISASYAGTYKIAAEESKAGQGMRAGISA